MRKDDAASTNILRRDQSLAEQQAGLVAAIKAKPNVVELRVHLAQLSMLTGNWTRAVAQLQTAATLAASAIPMAQMYREAIRCEIQREKIFAGELAPQTIGQPEPWFATLSQSLASRGKDNALADELMQQAFEAAPATAFVLDETPVDWLADADSRLGPICEIILKGQYYWLPFDHIQRLELEAPNDLRDLVWLPGRLTLRNGGQHVVLIPSRYPRSYGLDDERLALASLTRWEEIGADAYAGHGQRSWVSNVDDHAFLAVRALQRADEDGAEDAPGTDESTTDE
ncbi:type VI secretion system protein ImpE [Tahibacter aquaticus]|uniref:Type VI secretion system protein ImpE n=1 Tax=Tahibacter aquaticus TaxID=520092 RepID=A0A4R6Z7T3_9GAMM|nr:type VI secretion system accessory protein TagJ [Tahibacter aquaticus]TDR47871.1 type VI secretion system protein ImpE [Tahibacter aquaticus]